MALEETSTCCVLAWQRQRQIRREQHDKRQTSAFGPDFSRQHVSYRCHQTGFDGGYFSDVHHQPPSTQPCSSRRPLSIQVCQMILFVIHGFVTHTTLPQIPHQRCGGNLQCTPKVRRCTANFCFRLILHSLQVPFALWLYPAQCS